MSDIMWSHEDQTLEFRQGFREGMEFATLTVNILIKELMKESKINQACWVTVARDWIEDEISMYEVGDEE